jgi:hypothetical protein
MYDILILGSERIIILIKKYKSSKSIQIRTIMRGSEGCC